MPIASPYVHFDNEPATLAEQFASMGGSTIRHSFCERGYNPGLVENRWSPSFLRSDYLMTFRSQEVSDRISVSQLSLCGVDRCGTVKWTSPLTLPEIPGEGTPMQEDGRLLWLNGHLYIAFSNVRLRSDGVTFKQSLVRLDPVFPADMSARVFKPEFKAGPLMRLNYGNNHHAKQGHEKNWQFFDAEGDLAFVYSIHPHVVITPASGKHHVTASVAAQDWTKAWGEMHGGTPPLRLPDGRYLSFFNSFVGHKEHQRRYVIGAYLFNGAKDNFRISHITAKPLVVGSEREGFLWESPVYWEPIVAFATGAAFEEGKDAVRLSYGVNDCYAQSSIIPMQELLSRMVRI